MEPSEGREWVVYFSNRFFWPETARQKAPCELENCHGGEFNRSVRVQAFFHAQLHVTASVFPHDKTAWLSEYTKLRTLFGGSKVYRKGGILT